MIVITGAAGFIASNLVGLINSLQKKDIIVVDDFSNDIKNKNLVGKDYLKQIDRMLFFSWLEQNHQSVDFVFHLGARTDTAEFDTEIFNKLNLGYSKQVWELCSKYSLPLIYASSAATYGMGELGYEDSHEIIPRLKPLNPYGESKNEFDKWILKSQQQPPYWIGLKFFNVYGPNEYHKGRMASVIFHAYNQILQNGSMKLFRSHRNDIADGKQMRDFIYVADVVRVILYCYNNRPEAGIYNLGTGKARTFMDLTLATFKAMGIPPAIDFIDTPTDIRDKYQYFTEADMKKLYLSGFPGEFTSLEQGVQEYVQRYLMSHSYY